MIETIIYIPTIIICHRNEAEWYGDHLKVKLNGITPPEGIEIEYKFMEDPLLFPILDDFIKFNNPEPIREFSHRDYLIRFTIISKTDLHFKRIEWLEEVLRNVVKTYDSVGGIISFYFINGGDDLQILTQVKAFNRDDLNSYLTEDYLDADYTPIIKFKDLIKRHYYTDEPDFNPETASSSEALYLLKWGDPEMREAVG